MGGRMKIYAKASRKSNKEPIDLFSTKRQLQRSSLEYEITEEEYELLKTLKFTEDEKEAVQLCMKRSMYISHDIEEHVLDRI